MCINEEELPFLPCLLRLSALVHGSVFSSAGYYMSLSILNAQVVTDLASGSPAVRLHHVVRHGSAATA